MAARHPPRNRQKDAKTDSKDRGAATLLPAGTKGYKKIHIAELPIIDVNSGPNISNIRDALIQYCQREIGPIAGIFTEGMYKAPV